MNPPDWAPLLLAVLPVVAFGVMVFATVLLFLGAIIPGLALAMAALWAAYVAALRRALLSQAGL